ncbi:MAG: hypothetical protein KC613_20835, partial [Myxococcales bacterium]|nr:hypothetical protein [Myxococcales bacterium]
RTPAGGAPVLLEAGVDYRVWPSEGFVHLDEAAFPDGLATGDVVRFGDYQAFTGLIREAQRLVSGDPTASDAYPPWRAAGVEAAVLPARVFDVQAEITTAIRTGFDYDATVAAVRAVVSGYINGLDIGEDVIVAEIIERVMGVPGLYDCTVVQPPENIVVADLEVARIQTENLEVS